MLSRSLLAMAWVVLSSCPVSARDRVTDTDVDELIEHLVKVLKDRYEPLAEIRIDGVIKIHNTGERVSVKETYRGDIVSRSPRKIVFKTVDGMTFDVSPQDVERIDEHGHFRGEKIALQSHGGRTALATLALLSSGVGRHDPVIRGALDYLQKHPLPGTYGRALRASVYSSLAQQLTSDKERQQAMKLLRRDARWLILAMNASDGYTYTTHVDQVGKRKEFSRSDNSNSQFGTLGLWVSALAGYNVPIEHWSRVDRFWTREQNDDGGWGYHFHQKSTQNMTIAGINSLVVLLDQLYGRKAGTYRLFKGITMQPHAPGEVARVRNSIARGFNWLAGQGKSHGEAYTQYGLERLGVATGRKYIANADWYREGAQAAMSKGRWEVKRIEDVSMWLLFLAYGRAPVLVNKLAWGDDQSSWDYYYGDVYHACRFLSNTYEQIYKWQILDATSSLHDLQDAPLLYIAGQSRFSLPEDSPDVVRQYIDGGGTVVGHANLSSSAFAASFKRYFEDMFTDWGAEFRKLPFSHPIYHTAFGGKRSKFKIKVPIWALSDGYREAVILFPKDIAGAWHQSRNEKFVDLFRIFANVRFYAAGRYRDLPKRLRSDAPDGPAISPRESLRIARPKTGANRGGARVVWKVMNRMMTRHYGISLDVDHEVLLSNINEGLPYDLVHIPGQGRHQFTEAEMGALKKYCDSGGLVVIEALGGDAQFASSATDQLKVAFGDHFEVLPEGHPLVEGKFPMGKPLGKLKYTLAGRKIPWPTPGLKMMALAKDDSVQLVLSPLDLSAATCRHYVHGLAGYEPESAQRILRNLLLYQLGRRRSRQ